MKPCGLDRKLEGLLCSSVVDPGPTPLNETLQPRRHADKFMRSAQRELSVAGDGVARVMAILAWIHRNVDYVAGVRDPQTTAEETFADRAGVCRDFNHLGITLCRALGIPARLSVHTRCNGTHRTFTPSETRSAVLNIVSSDHGNPLIAYAAKNSSANKDDIKNSTLEENKPPGSANMKPMYLLGQKIVTTSISGDKRTLQCSGEISVAVNDIKAAKEINFTVQQSSDGKLSVSVAPFQF